MDNKTFREHYVGKEGRYPGGYCDLSQTSRKVYDKAGALQVSLELDGAGQWRDMCDEHGALSNHSHSKQGLETSRPGEKHKEGGIVHSHEQNIKRKAGGANGAAASPVANPGVAAGVA